MNDSAADRRSPLGLFPGQSAPRLYDRVLEVLRTRHYSRRTEEAYLHWIRRFLLFHNGTHPRELAENDVSGFLTHLAVGEKVAASTQNQALAAVLFLYEHVLEQPLDRIEGVVRARKPKRLPGVLTRDEVQAILAELDGAPRLVSPRIPGSKGGPSGGPSGWAGQTRDHARISSFLPTAASSERGGIIRTDRSA
jgi:integrase